MLRGPAWKTMAVGSVLVLVVAAGAFAWLRQPLRTAFYTDADTIRSERGDIEPRDILWQPPVPLAEQINTSAEDYEPQLSWDGLTLFFVRGKAGENADLFTARRTPLGWTEPTPLAALNTEYDELGPEPSRDGKALYFYSDRPGGVGGYDVWVSRRTEDGWGEPENLGPQVNSVLNDYGPTLTPDGATLYFSSNRPLPDDTRVPNPEAWPATVREEFLHRTYDLYAAQRTPRGFSAALPVLETLTPHNEATPCVSPSGDFVYFASDRPGGSGGFDLYRCRIGREGLWDPENLEGPVNTPANELDPGLTQLGYGLYFSSDRLLLPTSAADVPEDAPQTVSEGAQRPDYNLYFSSSREVYLDVEESEVPPINWAGLWPYLLWLLLALLLLATLLALWGALREKRLGLLARCLLASLFAHLLLLLLFSFMKVTEQVMEGLRSKEPIQVSLASHQQASALTDQVRPDFSDAPTLASEAVTLQESQTLPPQAIESTMVTTDVARAVPEATPLEATQPREAEPLVQRPQPTLEPQVNPANEALEMPVPDQVVAESAPETSPEAIAATLDVPRMEPTPPRFATSQPVRSQDELRPRDTLASSVQLPSATPTMRESSFEVAPAAAPQPRALPEAMELALDLPSEAPTRDTEAAESAEAPALAAATSELAPQQVEASVPQLTLAVQLTPLTPTSEAFALASSTEPVAVEARPDRVTPRDLKPRLQPQEMAALPLGLFQEEAVEVAEAADAAPTSSSPASPAVALAPAAVAPVDTDARELVAVPTGATTPQAVALPVAAADRAMREATARRATLPALTVRNPMIPLSLDLELPTETEMPTPSGLAHRLTPERRSLLEEMGGDSETEAAVARALKWLAAHQSPSGGWDGLHFDRGCGACDGQSEYAVDAAVTGLSLLCFLGAGHTHTEAGPYRENVTSGLAALLNRQDDNGNLGVRETLYSHGIATIALAEAYALTGDPDLYQPLQKAVGFIAASSNPRTGGWRYQPGEEADTSVTGWQVMALASARTAGLAVPQGALQSAERWLDRAETRRGLYVYQPGEPISVTMTAESMFMRQLLGSDRSERRMQISARTIARDLPDWDEADTYRWYYTTLALFHHQGPNWGRWNESLKRELLAAQRTSGKPSGSWDPKGEWADIGGRVYQTALCTLMLETYYRYLPMYAEQERLSDDPDSTMGRLYGRVYDRERGVPLEGALVRLDRPDGEPLEVRTDAGGNYQLDVPQMPAHFALTATHAGYTPGARSAEAAALADGRLQVNFGLEPMDRNVVALEAEPRVHHLGNDRWEGRINSQFQRSAEGTRLRLAFALDEDWDAERYDAVIVTFLAKGVQCPHRIRINGRALSQRLENSPEDGSYGEVRVAFSPRLLESGTNQFELRASSCAGDVDDFEFVNVQLRFED